MQIAEYQKEEMEIKKKQDEENTVWFVKTEGKGGTSLLSSTGAPGVQCIIDGLPSVSFTLPIPYFSVICYKTARYSLCTIPPCLNAR
jgi:hypothetical protein